MVIGTLSVVIGILYVDNSVGVLNAELGQCEITLVEGTDKWLLIVGLLAVVLVKILQSATSVHACSLFAIRVANNCTLNNSGGSE